MKLLFDNPVLRHTLRTRRRLGAALYPAVVPVIGIAVLVLTSAVWRRAGLPFHLCVWRWAHRLGQPAGPVDLALAGVALLFWVHCVLVPLYMLRDPLRQAIRDHAGLQLVATGLTPATWLTGHLLGAGYELFIALMSYAPVFALCHFFGASTAPDLVQLLVAGLLLGVSARLVLLLSLRCPGTGTVAWFLLMFACLLPLQVTVQPWAPLASLGPLPLFRGILPGAIALCAGDGGTLLWSWSWSWSAERLALWPTGWTWFLWMVQAHVALWCLVLPGIVAGDVRMHLNWSSPGIASSRVPSSRNSPARTVPATRLEWVEVMRLFSGNGSSCCRALWEFLHLLAVTVVVGLLAGMWILHLEGVLSGADRLLGMSATVIVLAGGIACGLCIDRGVLEQRRLPVYALPHLAIAAVRILGLIGGVFYIERVTGEGWRLPGSILPALVLLLFSLVGIAVWQSLLCRSRAKAQLGVFLGLCGWVGLTALVMQQGWLPLTGAAGIVSALTFAIAVAGISVSWRSRRRAAS